jgi:hypothetical protein
MAHLSSDRPQGPVAGEPIEDQFSAIGLTGAVDLLWSLLDMTPSLGPTKMTRASGDAAFEKWLIRPSKSRPKLQVTGRTCRIMHNSLLPPRSSDYLPALIAAQ